MDTKKGHRDIEKINGYREGKLGYREKTKGYKEGKSGYREDKCIQRRQI
jgi:hypothetical protein